MIRRTLFFVTMLCLIFWQMPLHAQQQTEVPEGESVDPTRYFTIKTDHFRIHYPEDLATAVVEIKDIAEAAFSDVTTRLQWLPKGRINLVLSNKNDQSNGFATVAPYNYVFLFVAPPQANTSLDNYKEYWRLLLQHELTHIVHIDQHHGYVSPFRFLLGKVINPNAATPVWMREGMAVYEESLLDDKYGRNNSDYANMIIRTSVFENTFPSIDQANGSTQHFPGGTGPYLFGGKFFDWLADTYGEDRMYKYQEEYSSSLLLYAVNSKARRVYGKKFPELWDEFKVAQTTGAQTLKTDLEAKELTPLDTVLDNKKNKTSLSLYVQRPNSTGFAYSEKSFDEGVRIVIYPTADAKPIILKKQALGQMSFSHDGRYLAFASFAGIESKANHAEVFLYDLEKLKMGRMYDEHHKTLAMHATDPDWSPVDDGSRWLVMVRQFVDTDQLVVFDAVEKKNYIITSAESKTQFSNPRFSPDGQMIVVSRKDPNGQRDIVVYSSTGEEISKITNDAKADDFPIFSADGREIYFSSYYTGVSNIFSYNSSRDVVSQISNVLGGVFQPRLTDDGQSILVESYSSFGNNVQKFALVNGYKSQYASYSVHGTPSGNNASDPIDSITYAYYEITPGWNSPKEQFKKQAGQPTYTVPSELTDDATAAQESQAHAELLQKQNEAIYKKNRRGNRQIDLDLPDPNATPEPQPTTESDTTNSTTPAVASAEKNEPSAYKDELQGKPADVILSLQHPTGYKNYSPFPILLIPRYVMPSIASSESATLFGLTTGNFDPLNRHLWNANVNYRTDASYLGAGGSYIYKRFNPMLFVGAIRYAVDWGELDGQQFFEDRWQVYGGTSYGLKSNRFTLSYFYENREALTDGVSSDLLLNMQPYAGLRFRYTFGKWSQFADSISREDGLLFKLGADYVDSLLGSDDINEEIVTTADLRFFWELPWAEHHVLALRGTLGWKFGDPQINGVFRLGGPFGEGTGTTPLSNRVFPMRGLPGISLAGDRAFLASAEYRLPLFSNINRGISTWPIFLDKMHLAFFADAGDITYEEYDLYTRVDGANEPLFSRIMVAPGVEWRSDLVIGYGLPITVRLGYAVILTNVDRVDVLNDPFTGSSIKNGTIYTQVGTSF